MHTAIEWPKLPRLFQDAIQLAQLLQIQFIWIDALCIVQDDKEDWEKEAVQMGKIYRNAYAVIGATSCNNSSESIVSSPFQEVRIPITQKKHEYRSTFSSVITRTLGGDITWPLHFRGWAYQEILLASRYIDFDSNGTQLHCGEETIQADAASKPKSLDTASLDKGRSWEYRRYRSPDFRQPWAFPRIWAQILNEGHEAKDIKGQDISFIKAWHEVVMMYTNRRLTYISDLLPGLSGIAWEYLKRGGLNETYCAGLWRNSFVENLTWAANHEAKPAADYQAPSWSWASLRGSVDYSCALTERRTRLVEVSCSIKGANPLGRVTGGFAILEGPIFRCLLRVKDFGSGIKHELVALRQIPVGFLRTWHCRRPHSAMKQARQNIVRKESKKDQAINSSTLIIVAKY